MPECPDGFAKFNGSCYYFDTGTGYPAQHHERCRNRGAALFVPSTAEENAYVKSVMVTHGKTFVRLKFPLQLALYSMGFVSISPDCLVLFDSAEL